MRTVTWNSFAKAELANNMIPGLLRRLTVGNYLGVDGQGITYLGPVQDSAALGADGATYIEALTLVTGTVFQGSDNIPYQHL